MNCPLIIIIVFPDDCVIACHLHITEVTAIPSSAMTSQEVEKAWLIHYMVWPSVVKKFLCSNAFGNCISCITASTTNQDSLYVFCFSLDDME